MSLCCFCIPIKTGCILLACLYVLIQYFFLFSYYKLASAIEKEENEDEENIKQKEKIKSVLFWQSISAVLRILLGISTIVAAFWERPSFMRACAVSIIGIEFISFIWLLLMTPQATNLLWVLWTGVPLMVALYTGFTLWNFADLLEFEEQSFLVYVANGPVEENLGEPQAQNQ